MCARLRSLALTTIVLAWVVWGRAALADQPTRVVLLEPPPGSPHDPELMTRLRGELAAGPFEVHRARMLEGDDVRAALEREAARTQSLAAVVILSSREGPSADVWVVDRATGKTVIRTVQARATPRESAAAVLAIRAVELLRASLLEAIEPAPARPPLEPLPPLPKAVSHWVAPRADPPLSLMVAGGIGMLHAFGGVGPAFSPVLRGGLERGGLAGRLTVAGPLLGPALDVEVGEVTVRQELATLEAAFSRPLGGGSFVPTASLGVGAYHLVAFGSLEPPFRSATDDVWAVLFTTGVGMSLTTSHATRIFLEGRALFSAPRPVIVVGGDAIARAGGPSLLLTLGMEARVLP